MKKTLSFFLIFLRSMNCLSMESQPLLPRSPSQETCPYRSCDSINSTDTNPHPNRESYGSTMQQGGTAINDDVSYNDRETRNDAPRVITVHFFEQPPRPNNRHDDTLHQIATRFCCMLTVSAAVGFSIMEILKHSH